MSILRKAAALGHRLRLLNDIRRDDGRMTVPYEAVGIEITSMCNLSCPLCPVAKDARTVDRQTTQMSREDFERIVRLTAPITKNYVLNMYGESLMHREFFEFLDMVAATGRGMSISTNLNYGERLAQRLSQYEGLDVICSIDGWDSESYKRYRVGGRFEVMARNLAILAKGKCKVHPQFLVDGDDKEGCEAFCRFIESEIGIPRQNIILKPMNKNFKNELTREYDGVCHYMYANIYFTSDGNLVPCCVHVGRDLFLSHISAFERPEDVLNAAPLVAARKQLAHDKNVYKSCVSCPGRDIRAETTEKLKSALSAPRF